MNVIYLLSQDVDLMESISFNLLCGHIPTTYTQYTLYVQNMLASSCSVMLWLTIHPATHYRMSRKIFLSETRARSMSMEHGITYKSIRSNTSFPCVYVMLQTQTQYTIHMLCNGTSKAETNKLKKIRFTLNLFVFALYKCNRFWKWVSEWVKEMSKSETVEMQFTYLSDTSESSPYTVDAN